MKPLILTYFDAGGLNKSEFLTRLSDEGFSTRSFTGENEPSLFLYRPPFAAVIVFDRFDHARLDRALTSATDCLTQGGAHPTNIVVCGESIPANEEKTLREWGAQKVVQPSEWDAKAIADRVLAALFGGFDTDIQGATQSNCVTFHDGAPLFISCRVPYKGKTVDRKIIGPTKVMRDVFAEIRFYSTLTDPILIRGESGTGKELVAAAIHSANTANDARKYITVNIAEITEDLLPNELFGHSQGAFTGAVKERKGLLEEADSGTVFIDEIGDLSLDNQARLLRVFTNREIRPVGAEHEKRTPFNARLIFATHQPLEAKCSEGEFRQDLYWRITEGHTIQLRPLRERKGDLELLVKEFFNEWYEDRKQHNSVFRLRQSDYDKVVDLCVKHAFPGNLRSLRGMLNGCFNLSLRKDKRFNISRFETEIEADQALVNESPERSRQLANKSDSLSSIAFDPSAEAFGDFKQRALTEYCAAVFRTANKRIDEAIRMARTSKKTFYKYLPKSEHTRRRLSAGDSVKPHTNADDG